MEFIPKISDPPKPGSARLAKKEPKIAVGEEIFRRFIFTSELGSGRCSTSWLVEDPRFRRDVVLKLFRSSNNEETEEERVIWRDFLRRLRILNHPDIVITMEFFHEGSWLALSSTYENGPTLAGSTLKEGKKLPLPQIRTVLKTVGQAIAAAHDKCLIVHGNLNAYNILLPTRRRAAKITDFGFHPPLPPPTEEIAPELQWKLACLSPERLQGGPPSHADDIYAYGAVAFQLFTGANPPLDTLGHLDKSAAQTLLAETPPEWTQQILIALSPEPADRPEVLSLLLQELNIYEEFDPRQKLIEKAEASIAHVKKTPRAGKSPDNLRPKSTFLFRASIALCVIAAPVAVGWIIYHNSTVTRQMQEERVKEEVVEKKHEAEESAQVIALNDRLGGDTAPSLSNIQLYKQTLNAPAPTPKPTPLVINSGAKDFYSEGQTKMAVGDPAGAMESYELAIVLQPDWPDLLEARGAALLAIDRADDAVSEYSKALILEPNRVNCLVGRAKANLASSSSGASGDPAAAKADLQAALKIDPNNTEVKKIAEKNKFTLQSEPGIIQ